VKISSFHSSSIPIWFLLPGGGTMFMYFWCFGDPYSPYLQGKMTDCCSAELFSYDLDMYCKYKQWPVGSHLALKVETVRTSKTFTVQSTLTWYHYPEAGGTLC